MSSPTPRACRSCGTLVYLLVHPFTGKTAPIEAVPIDDGNVVVDLGQGTYTIVARGHGQHLNHFARCPQARQWRSGGFPAS